MTPDAAEAASRPAPGAGLWLLSALGVAVVLAVWIGAFADWNASTEPVLNSRPHNVLPHVLIRHHAPGGEKIELPYPSDAPLLRLTSALMDRFGRAYPVFMSAQLIAFAALIIALAAIAAQIGGPAAGFLAAVFAACMPAVAETTLAFDDHLVNMAFVAISAALILASDGFRRVIPAALAGAAAGSMLKYAFTPSNGIFGAVSVGFFAAGCAFQIFSERRGRFAGVPGSAMKQVQLRENVRRLLGAALFLAAFYFSALRLDSLYYTSYVFGQVKGAAAGEGARRLADFLAYPDLIFRYQMGPVLSAAALLGIAGLFAGKAKNRFALLAWFLGPLVFLMISRKKNLYYDFYNLIAAAPIIGAGLLSLPGRRAKTALAVACALGAFLFGFHAIHAPGRVHAWAGAFESGPSFFVQAPLKTPDPDKEQAEHVLRAARQIRPAGTLQFLVTGSNDMLPNLHYFLLMRDPDAQLYSPVADFDPPPGNPRPFILRK